MASSFAANSKHIAKFAAKPFPQQQAADAVTPAFEAYAYGKIVSLWAMLAAIVLCDVLCVLVPNCAKQMHGRSAQHCMLAHTLAECLALSSQAPF
jgi:hypothetical protein